MDSTRERKVMEKGTWTKRAGKEGREEGPHQE
jgi:hypothetical protein